MSIVAIVGRPNVGKSTLFNRLTESRDAIMDSQSGVTRDRNYGQVEWGKKKFTLIDTGGYVEGSEDLYEHAIRRQVKLALEEADIILFMVDAIAGITVLDEEFANVVRTFKKPILLASNKIDIPAKDHLSAEFYALGLGEVYSIAATNGLGTGDLLDALGEYMPDAVEEEPSLIPRIAILGRPNVGKSSFINVLIGKERSIVTDQAGTTRDAIHTTYKAYGKELILVDTAGIRKKSKVHEDIEFYSVMRSLRALENSDICVIIIDATRGLEAQDVNLITLSERNGKGIVIIVNKWDLVEKDYKTHQEFTKVIYEKIPTFMYIPLIFTSMTEKQRIFQALELILEVHANRSKKIPTSKLNDTMLKAIEEYKPPMLKGKEIRIKYVTQVNEAIRPTFLFFCNLPQYVSHTYKRYLENKLREAFDFKGVPIQLFFRKKNKD